MFICYVFIHNILYEHKIEEWLGTLYQCSYYEEIVEIINAKGQKKNGLFRTYLDHRIW